MDVIGREFLSGRTHLTNSTTTFDRRSLLCALLLRALLRDVLEEGLLSSYLFAALAGTCFCRLILLGDRLLGSFSSLPGPIFPSAR